MRKNIPPIFPYPKKIVHYYLKIFNIDFAFHSVIIFIFRKADMFSERFRFMYMIWHNRNHKQLRQTHHISKLFKSNVTFSLIF